MAPRPISAPPYLRGPAPVWTGRTTRQWLTAGAVVALAVLITLGGLGVWIFVRSDDATAALVDRSSPALVQATSLEAALVDQETGVRGYGLAGQTDFLQPYQQGIAQEQTAADAIRTLLADDKRGIADLDRVLAAAAAWQEYLARPIAAASPSATHALATARAAQGKTLFDAVRAATATQQAHLTADRQAARLALQRVDTLRSWVFSAIAAVILLLTVLVFEGLRRGVTAPLGRLSSDVRRVAEGSLDRPMRPTGPADLRGLASDVEAMRLRLVGELEAVEEGRRLLDERAAELQRSNAELEQFAYVASHDLQEPLRKVASFCQLLQRRYGGTLDERADQYIAYAVDGANRMQTLIQDLLAFSRVGRTLDKHSDVELEGVYRDVLDALSVTVEENGAQVTHDPLPAVAGDRTQLGVLLQNLIGNAVKFRDPDRPPRVHLSAERAGDRWAFAVTDNGIGIEPEYAERVFTIFQRLHSRDDYPGNGIGLAVCRKIVDFHGGEIAVDPGHTPGTRITFSLPAVIDAVGADDSATRPAESGTEGETESGTEPESS